MTLLAADPLLRDLAGRITRARTEDPNRSLVVIMHADDVPGITAILGCSVFHTRYGVDRGVFQLVAEVEFDKRLRVALALASLG